jgi:ADP-L-glycero-D-manno-heptose 6-epimerase
MIILTGGAGFVGSNLLKRLNAEGECDILVVDNLRNADKYRNLVGAKFSDYVAKEEFLKLLEAGKVDNGVSAIFHQGACTDTLEYNGEYMMRNNYDYSKALLHFALDRSIPLVYASTAAVYGHAELATEAPENEWPLNIYGYSKLAFDQYVRRNAANAKSTVVGLRYFNVYGNGEAHKGKMSSMVFHLANQVRDTGVARLFGPVGKYGPGEQTRDFVYVKDLVEMNLYFWRRPDTRAIVNAGTGESRSWNDLAKAVIAELGGGKIEYFDFPESLKSKYQFNTRADTRQLRSLGYDREFYTLEQGVYDYLSTADAETKPFRSSAI